MSFLIIRQELGRAIDSGNHRHLKSKTWWHRKSYLYIIISIHFLYVRFLILFREWFLSLRRLSLFLYLLLFHYFNHIIYRDWFGRISDWGICQFIPMHGYVSHIIVNILLCISNWWWVALGWIIIGVGVGVAINFKSHQADNYRCSYTSKLFVHKIMI